MRWTYPVGRKMLWTLLSWLLIVCEQAGKKAEEQVEQLMPSACMWYERWWGMQNWVLGSVSYFFPFRYLRQGPEFAWCSSVLLVKLDSSQYVDCFSEYNWSEKYTTVAFSLEKCGQLQRAPYVGEHTAVSGRTSNRAKQVPCQSNLQKGRLFPPECEHSTCPGCKQGGYHYIPSAGFICWQLNPPGFCQLPCCSDNTLKFTLGSASKATILPIRWVNGAVLSHSHVLWLCSSNNTGEKKQPEPSQNACSVAKS